VDKVTKKPLKGRKINSFPQEPLIYAEKLVCNRNLTIYGGGAVTGTRYIEIEGRR
jgi:hypothetical protein